MQTLVYIINIVLLNTYTYESKTVVTHDGYEECNYVSFPKP